MFKKIFTIAILLCLLFATEAYCENYNNWGNTDTIRLLKRELPIDLIYTGAPRGGVSTVVSSVSNLSGTQLNYSVFQLSGATKTFTIGDGYSGKTILFVKAEDDPRILKIDLRSDVDWTAHTGFRSIAFGTAAGSFVELTWIDSTYGWVITGQYNCTIAYD